MENQFESEFVYIIDKNNTAHFVMNGYKAKMDDAYRTDIYLPEKKYCVLDLYLTDEKEIEGEFLPYIGQDQWRKFFSDGPTKDTATILKEAGLSQVAVSKLAYIRLESNSRSILEYAGFVASAEGVREFAPEDWAAALAYARSKTTGPAEQEPLAVNYLIEQI